MNLTEYSRTLQDKAVNFEKQYFSDMTLQDYKKDYNLICKMGKDKPLKNKGIVSYQKLKIKYWNFYMTDKYPGITIPKKRAIMISKDHENGDLLLLHEMIHAYEYNLYCFAEEKYSQYILLQLYSKLLTDSEIPINLIIRCNMTQGANSDSKDNREFRKHSLLFTLKSYDLDKRMNLEYGTILGYNLNFENTMKGWDDIELHCLFDKSKAMEWLKEKSK
jgi:hypothetical protein